jgi:hypothetical protein
MVTRRLKRQTAIRTNPREYGALNSMARKQFSLGSVSSGTMITEDVFDSCIYALQQLNKKRARAIQREWNNVEKDCPDHAGDDCANCDEARSEILNETLWNALNEYAAPYTYFGAHPGDGSDYGFWIDFDSVEEAARDGEILKIDDTSAIRAYHRDYRGLVLHVNDHGNMTLYYCNSRRNLREIWSCV